MSIIVHEIYNSFLEGKIEIVDPLTGECYKRDDSDFVKISTATVFNILTDQNLGKQYRETKQIN